MRVLGIVGSPRRGGNTELLVDAVLRGAEEAGAAVEKVLLTKLTIGPCRGCNHCRRTGECVQKDDLPLLVDKMQGSEVWVLGTPVYWWGPSAQFKAYLDRWYAWADDEHVGMFKGRRVIVVIPMGDDDPATARHVVGMFTDALTYLDAELYATVLAPGADDLGEVKEYPDVLQAARRAGRAAAEK